MFLRMSKMIRPPQGLLLCRWQKLHVKSSNFVRRRDGFGFQFLLFCHPLFFCRSLPMEKTRNGHGFSQKMEHNGAAPHIAHKNCRCCRLESKIYRLIALTLIECTRRHKERAARVVEMVENKLIFPPPTLSHSLRGTLRMFYCAFRTTNEAVVINF